MQARVRYALGAVTLALCGWAVLRFLPSRPVPAAPDETAGESSTANNAASRGAPDSPNQAAEPFYIGSAQCAECHADELHTYQQTAHSQALAEIDPQAQPPDGQFEHALSGRSYRVYRAGGALRHREQLSTIDFDDLSQDYAVKYVIGSGRHGRSYLIEDAGFLIESPITWYESRQAWGMSPGYDRRSHQGFERAVDAGCISCHAGRAESIDGALNRIAIHEQAIGCEACHAPGSTHAAERRAAKNATLKNVTANETIVHPGKLSRDLSEAICARCHLQSDAAVLLSGRDAADFRPGRALAEYRIDYRLDRAGPQMKVAGHVEQMRLSRCYQKSDSLTCTTCHNPHDSTPPERAAAEYRNKCLACHAAAACRVDVAERTKTEPGDNCAACHMPPTRTEVPHAAFTHHRIGIHRPAAEAPADEEESDDSEQSDDEPEFAELTPLADVSHLSEIERERCLGLAYLEFSQNQDAPSAERYARRAVELLEKVRAQGVRDAYVDAGLARAYWSTSPPRAAELAMAALEDAPLPPGECTTALYVLADFSFRTRQWTAAQSALVQSVRLRRHPVDWQLLGLCQAAQGDEPGAIQSLKRAAEIIPYDRAVHEQLAQLYVQLGQPDGAARQRQLAKLLELREQARARKP